MLTTDEDTSATTVDVLGNDSDPNGDTLSITTYDSTSTQGGDVVYNNDGTFTYTPAANYYGPDSFDYLVTDGILNASASVIISVLPVNDPPTANDDVGTTNEDTPFTTVNVLNNDSDNDEDVLSIDGFDAISGQGGTVTALGDGTFSYTPAENFYGTDSFGYTLSDGQGGTATATVTITVTAVNDPPVAADDSVTTNEDTLLVTGNVLLNDTDVDGDALTVASFSAVSVAGGTVSSNGDGTFNYTPPLNFHGTDSFTYTATDGFLTSTATVTVTVDPVNDPPQANPDSGATDEDTSFVTTNVLANDTDVDLDALTVEAHDPTSVQGGSVVYNNDGTFTYTPPADFHGTDSFGYTASDGQATSSTTVTVTVRPINDPPQANPDSGTTPEDTALTTANVLANDTDIDGDTLSVSSYQATSTAGGTVGDNGDGTFNYTPPANFYGTDTFTYTLDGGCIVAGHREGIPIDIRVIAQHIDRN